MKTFILFIGAILLIELTGCGPSKAQLEAKERAKNQIYTDLDTTSDEGDYYLGDIEIRVIDSCEYIIAAIYSSGISITHKANCRNPIHQKNK